MGLIILLLIGVLIIYVLYRIWVWSVLWVAEPLIKHFDEKEKAEERFRTEMSKIPGQLKLLVDGIDKPVRLSKELYDKAQSEPQRLPKSNLWIYKDHIYPHKPK